MSRLGTMSATAKAAIFGQDVSDELAILMTLTGGGLEDPVYITDTPAIRISETDDNVRYGVTSSGINYIALPMSVLLPSDEDEGDGGCSIAVHDITREILPLLRSATGEITVDLTLVLTTTPDVIEAEFPGYRFYNFQYDADSVTCSLGLPADEREPIPCDVFSPQHFPGGF